MVIVEDITGNTYFSNSDIHEIFHEINEKDEIRVRDGKGKEVILKTREIFRYTIEPKGEGFVYK